MLRSDLGQISSALPQFRDNISTGLHQTCLLEKNLTIEQIPIYVSRPTPAYHNRTIPAVNSFHKSVSVCNSNNYTDRLIPPRRQQNFDATRYKLMNQSLPMDNEIKPYLDVIEQINMLNTGWKKRLVTQNLNQLKLFKGIRSQRIFNFNSKPPLFSTDCLKSCVNVNKKKSVIQNSSFDGVWKAKSRNKPLLKYWETAVELSGYIHFPSRGAVDWSGKNIIMVAVEQEILLFKDTCVTKSPSMIVNIEPTNIGTAKIRCVKWNYSGDCFLMYSESLKLCCYDVLSSKVIWKHNCVCSRCIIRCIAWTHSDRQVVIGCNDGIVCIFNVSGSNAEIIDYASVHQGIILDLVISPNDDFVATTGTDKNIRIHSLKEMIPFLEIGYYDSSEALAWHPWEKGILCIGGGLGDGSLSLWDVPKQKSLDYRRVNFLSRVKHLAWNNLSGELVVVWYYWNDSDTRLTTIPVLASWNQIVDAISIQKTTPLLTFKNRIANVMWNPYHTKIGLQTADRMYLYDFFGDSATDWKENNKKSKIRPAGQKSIFDLNCIR
ncbi:protein cortex [Microplitis demolitor]|uniref:protein cortex n=1 Tax=Microplitis demolitor TaxID=69319 RepID=UPI0004CD5141|nr:protein cortex [Microplitis demolitor]